MKNILLVNDDGFYAEGIQRLREQLKDYGIIYMVAPKNVMSAKSTSITIGNKKVEIEKIDDFNYVIDGTPADCTNFGLLNLGVNFDLVISGCNNGLNHSIASLWSGTLGACIQACYLGVPSIAFSASNNHMDHIEKYTRKTLDYIFKRKLPNKDRIISVNFPYTEKAKGIRFSRLSFNKRNVVWGDDGNLYQSSDKDIDFKDKNSDLYHVSHGYISITPLSGNIFKKEIYDLLKNRCKNENFND